MLTFVVVWMYGCRMAKNLPLGIRLDADERAALEKAAASEVSSMSALGRKAIVEWLRANGWLKPPRRPKGGRAD